MHAGQDSWLNHMTSPSGVLFGGSVFLSPKKKQLGFPLSSCRADPRLIGVGPVVTPELLQPAKGEHLDPGLTTGELL